jgi:anti-anti-sigma factor
MKYRIMEEDGFLLIEMFGNMRNNEALLAKRLFSPYLMRAGIRVIIDLKDLLTFEPVNLVGVLNGIRKKVDFLGGDLKLCSLRPELLSYFKENRLDRIFHLYEDGKEFRKEMRRSHGEG